MGMNHRDPPTTALVKRSPPGHYYIAAMEPPSVDAILLRSYCFTSSFLLPQFLEAPPPQSSHPAAQPVPIEDKAAISNNEKKLITTTLGWWLPPPTAMLGGGVLSCVWVAFRVLGHDWTRTITTTVRWSLQEKCDFDKERICCKRMKFRCKRRIATEFETVQFRPKKPCSEGVATETIIPLQM
ncbi:unnamed protein product [Lactuca saligna]|uniref:Uncharacterized protein n=1 Tax=Lactuca saligna TaxID=75948 RepID=A0AA35YUA9_LACSI|nr:unnamed protein product [Lactuca saligna]